MYTQCPECGTAFRVTADVLRQAAGKVRCGGCAHTFNALDYLSEQMPEQPAAEPSEPKIPELTPEPTDEGSPQTISAAQSAALLKTLDELAGSDIRIEDTGVEWRVLDEDSPSEAADSAIDDAGATDVDALLDEFDAADADEVAEEPGAITVDEMLEESAIADIDEVLEESVAADVDELLEDSPTPIDEFLTRTPEVVDSPEIFDEADDASESSPVDELRFDDNTPLPEDFAFDDERVTESEPEPEPEPEPESVPDPEPQPDIALSDPEEWTDILDEFEDLAATLDEEEPAEDSTDQSDAEADDEPDRESELALADDDEHEDTVVAADDIEEALDDSPSSILEELAALEDDDSEDADEDILLTDEDAEEDAVAEDRDEPEDELDIPPLSKEEQTVNMLIDQDLLAIAIEDEDGFASTIVIPEENVEDAAVGESADDIEERTTPGEAPGSPPVDESPGFETIVMEGEFVRTALDQEKLAADAAAAAQLMAAAAENDETENKKSGPNWRMIAGIAALILLLIFQIVHQSREALATIPAFNATVGSIYRAIGRPLQPAWDVTGWRFEATNGSAIPGDPEAGENDEELTVYSRIGNNSDQPLPYPLIGISLTDRFEETIGSRILEPAEYLADNLDPRKLIEPGVSFDAVISIRSPATNATGFKLNVCYRLASGRLRCAMDDFR